MLRSFSSCSICIPRPRFEPRRWLGRVCGQLCQAGRHDVFSLRVDNQFHHAIVDVRALQLWRSARRRARAGGFSLNVETESSAVLRRYGSATYLLIAERSAEVRAKLLRRCLCRSSFALDKLLAARIAAPTRVFLSPLLLSTVHSVPTSTGGAQS